MGQIAENILRIRGQMPAGVTLVAVSKTKSPEAIMEVYNTGQRVFGENRVQELVSKQPQLPADIEWHMIGHLQRNKVKYIAPFIDMIESVDSLRLLETINSEAFKAGRVIRCLLQFHIATEETKFGLDMTEARDIFAEKRAGRLDNIEICGLMGMATFTDNEEVVRKEFRYLKQCYEILKDSYNIEPGTFRIVSMGMSGDWMWAVEEGSNMVRIGSSIFGER